MHATLGYGILDVSGIDYVTAYFTLLANQSNFAAYAETPNQLAVANYIDANSTNPSGWDAGSGQHARYTLRRPGCAMPSTR